MAELAAATNAPLFTVKNSTVAISRGARITFDSTGVVVAAASTVRGDYVAATAIAASTSTLDQFGAAISMQAGAIVPALAAEAVAVGDPAYSDATGQWGKTSASHVLCGKWVTAAASSALGEVLIETVA